MIEEWVQVITEAAWRDNMYLTKSLKELLGQYAKAFQKYENRDPLTYLTCESRISADYVCLLAEVKVSDNDKFTRHCIAKVILRQTGRIQFKFNDCKHRMTVKSNKDIVYKTCKTFDELCDRFEKQYKEYVDEYYRDWQARLLKTIESLPG